MTALVALAAACGLAAVREVGQRRRLGAWACLGLFAGAALLTKQTAVLALLPLGLVLLFLNGSRWIGPAVAAGVCIAVCGPWYLQALTGDDDYLLRSAQANPAAVGPVQQLLFYPLAFAQQAWPALGGALLAGLGVVSWRRGLTPRTGRWSIPLAVLLCGLFLLMGIPKKYPRLLLPTHLAFLSKHLVFPNPKHFPVLTIVHQMNRLQEGQPLARSKVSVGRSHLLRHQ